MTPPARRGCGSGYRERVIQTTTVITDWVDDRAITVGDCKRLLSSSSTTRPAQPPVPLWATLTFTCLFGILLFLLCQLIGSDLLRLTCSFLVAMGTGVVCTMLLQENERGAAAMLGVDGPGFRSPPSYSSLFALPTCPNCGGPVHLGLIDDIGRCSVCDATVDVSGS